jgi:mannosyl-glycoprotein endo-beta-N-acetylglucosaminidase
MCTGNRFIVYLVLLGFAFRFVNGSTKHDEYRFFHWAGIDIFVYFSHQLVTIPPLVWINAAHLHGTKVLGM